MDSNRERSLKETYGTEILIENGSLDEVRLLMHHQMLGLLHMKLMVSHRDLTRGTRVKLFDMYYDKFKMGVKIIDYGKGTIKPALWGYNNTTAPKKKKRK